MNINTGEIKHFAPGETPGPQWVPLRTLARKDCPLCKGEGKKMVKLKGHGIKYQPCPCTQ